MKKLLSVLTFLLFGVISVNAQIAYAIWCEGSKTLYFDYLNNRIMAGQTYNRNETVTNVWSGSHVTSSPTDGNYPSWYTVVAGKVTSVVFREAFQNVRPTSTAFWFSSISALRNITGLNYLNTSEVTTMKGMFADCTGLTSLDVSGFNTSKVTDMSYMFSSMSGITTLDLRSFNTSKVTDMSNMFLGDYALQTILCNDSWSCSSSKSMFYGCSKLEGAVKYNSSKTDVSMANPLTGYFTSKPTGTVAYAVWCESTKTLYFDYTETDIKPGQVYSSRTETVTNVWSGDDVLNTPDNGLAAWYNIRQKVERVYFRESFKNARPISTAGWFYDFRNLTDINHLDYLNTSEVTNMYRMFYYCQKLTSLPVTTFNTSKVKDMSAIFYHCDLITQLDLTGFDTSKVTNMSHMFYSCYALQTIFCNDNWACESGQYMFDFCTALQGAVKYDYSRVDVSMANPVSGYFTEKQDTPASYAIWCDDSKTLYFDYTYTVLKPGMPYQDGTVTSVTQIWSSLTFWDRTQVEQVKTVRFMPDFVSIEPVFLSQLFYGCKNLEQIIGLEYLNTSAVEDMSYMFANCSSLTTLDLSSFDTSKVTNMAGMFSGCTSLTNLDLSNFNTSKVTDMYYLFYGCAALTTLDVSGFDVSSVTAMNYTFYECSNLKTIYCNDSWSCEKSDYMFRNCTNLVGAVKYDIRYVDVSMANPDTGYFTRNRYDLWLGGTQVTIANKDNIPVVKGKASYDPKTKTLTLKDVYLENGSDDYCIKVEIDGLTIKLEGENKLTSTKNGIGLVNSTFSQQYHATVTGPGKLEVEAPEYGIVFALNDLEVVDCAQLTVNCSLGFVGSMSVLFAALNPDTEPGQDFETLTISNSNVTMTGATIVTKFILDDNTVYMAEPAGGYFKFPYVYDISGEPATTIVIKKKGGIPGDVNEDGAVNINDVVAIINVMAGTATWQNADVNGDKAVNINDVVTVINIMASK